MFTTLLSTLLLSSSLDVIREHQLDTPEGRTEFLTEKLTPYVTSADTLNQQIIALSQEVTDKISLMNDMLPTLQTALHINADLTQLDTILNSEELTPEQQEVVDRLANLCEKLD